MSDQSYLVNPDELLGMMRKRRVSRSFTDQPIADDAMWKILEAGRWATSGGMRYPHRFLAIRDPKTIHLVRTASPGMLTEPPALIVLMIETEIAEEDSMNIEHWPVHWVDIGTAAMSMTTMAQSLGIGSCPVTSFSKSAVSAMLELPSNLSPEFILIMGYPAPQKRIVNPNAPKPITTRDLAHWERIGNHEP